MVISRKTRVIQRRVTSRRDASHSCDTNGQNNRRIRNTARQIPRFSRVIQNAQNLRYCNRSCPSSSVFIEINSLCTYCSCTFPVEYPVRVSAGFAVLQHYGNRSMPQGINYQPRSSQSEGCEVVRSLEPKCSNVTLNDDGSGVRSRSRRGQDGVIVLKAEEQKLGFRGNEQWKHYSEMLSVYEVLQRSIPGLDTPRV